MRVLIGIIIGILIAVCYVNWDIVSTWVDEGLKLNPKTFGTSCSDK